MKTKLITAGLMAAAFATLSACKKNNDAPVFTKAADFWSTHAIPEQNFSGDAETGFTITGEKGIKIKFPPNAFVDGSGTVVTGNVNVMLKEVMSKKDVLLSGVFTEANGQLLESGGELQVKAKKGDTKLFINPALNPDSAIQVEVPKDMNNRDMGLFVQAKRDQGQASGGGSGDYQYPETWMPAPYYPFGNGPTSYIFNLPDFTWVNCDVFYSNPNPKTTITVSPVFADDNNVTDLQVMLVFKNITTVVTLPYDFGLQQFKSYENSLPVGLEADLVLIGKDSEGYIQFGTQPVTISANLHVDATMHRSSQAEVDAFLGTIQ